MEILIVNIVWVKLCAGWDWLCELWYAMQQNYFVKRYHVNRETGKTLSDGTPIGTITEEHYCYYDKETRLLDWKLYPRHATVFSFFAAVFLYRRFRRLDKSNDYEYSIESYADVSFIHHVTTGEKL